METKAILRFSRISPKKAQLVADAIRNKNASLAENILNYSKTKASKLILKLLKSAQANLKDKVDEIDNLIISKIKVDQGPTTKRRKIRSRGRADLIKRRTSHITIVLTEIKKKSDIKSLRERIIKSKIKEPAKGGKKQG